MHPTQYDCSDQSLAEVQTYNLKGLADVNLDDYYSYRSQLERLSGETKYITSQKVALLKLLSTEKDKSFNRYLEALKALNQTQAKPLQVNIKTNSTYLAQNQQNNLKINDPQ